ncbi:endonuclease NucS domain-containing protein [Vulcanisaeta sp. EB80]|uniref:endonuclease NucS domain-containing protein n=1 Tax=Vulcanisaeta sp. EB80 TaxID=1650660 RepID=UPI00138A23FD|nr:endonuclease NucS domain-containing protein [Vulcanisaeta sp. EB80]
MKCKYEYVKYLRNSAPPGTGPEDLRLIIIKPDWSIQVHGGKYARPEVQLPRNSRIVFRDKEILAGNRKRKQALRIIIHETYWIEYPRLGGGLMIRELTHNDIVNFVRSYPRLFLDCDNVIIGAEDLFDELYKRLRGVGRPDLIAYGCGRLYVIEVKTEQVNTDDVSQLKRYVDGAKQYLDVEEVVGILVGESFTEDAERMAENYNFKIVEYPRPIAYIQVKELLGP